MLSDTKLFTIGKFDFHLRHLLIIGVLAISFSISAMIRSQAADYGFQLNEFDPFFNFRATQYLLDHGLNAYVHWHDDMSWYPFGRDVFSNAQVPLHVTDAMLYKVFGGGRSLYDFTILFPVVFGSLTAIVVFALVRVIAGTTAGLFASLFFALSPPIIVRGTMGWFKSEPLGLFYGILGLYLFLSGLKSENRKVAIAKLIGGGFFLAIGFASWGGVEFFLLPLGLFFIMLPFIRKDHKFLIWAVPLFMIVTLAVAGGLFARPGPGFVFGIRGLVLIGSTVLFAVIIVIQKFSTEGVKIRNSLIALGSLAVSGITAISMSGIVHASTTFRYLNALNPFLTSSDPLVDSVAEHATPTLSQNFSYFSILMLFAGLGIWLIFRKQNSGQSKLQLTLRNEMTVFALILGIVGAYAGSTFARLELLTATSVIVLSAVGLAGLTSVIFTSNFVLPKIANPKKSDSKKGMTFKSSDSYLGRIPKIAFVVVIIVLLLVPMVYPANSNWVAITKSPPTILNGGSNFAIATNDWPDTLNWIKQNTPKDSVVASWWDYGYWIQTLGERKTLADNATVETTIIANIARMLLNSPDDAWRMLKDMGANYVLVYVVGQKFAANNQDLYILGGGGDESKKQWFIKIGGLDSSKYLQDDSFTPTDYFWQNTLLGKMFPFTPITYYDPNTHSESPVYVSGYTAIYSKNIKYPQNGDGPVRLVYSSDGLNNNSTGVFQAVLLYQVNPDYKPHTQSQSNIESSTNSSTTINPTSSSTNSTPDTSGDIGIIDTKYGQIKFRLLENIAPKTSANFIKLATSGFYDGTVFHRIVPGFVIQAGDPNSIKGPRNTWGLGDAGYTIPPEFTDKMSFSKYTVGMARGSDVNSGSSQFFITVGDAPWLNDQYTLFGQVISGEDVVDKIAALKTNSDSQPNDPDSAKISKIIIEHSNSK